MRESSSRGVEQTMDCSMDGLVLKAKTAPLSLEPPSTGLGDDLVGVLPDDRDGIVGGQNLDVDATGLQSGLQPPHTRDMGCCGRPEPGQAGLAIGLGSSATIAIAAFHEDNGPGQFARKPVVQFPELTQGPVGRIVGLLCQSDRLEHTPACSAGVRPLGNRRSGRSYRSSRTGSAGTAVPRQATHRLQPSAPVQAAERRRPETLMSSSRSGQ